MQSITNKKAKELFENQKYDEALEEVKSEISQKETGHLYYDMGIILFQKENEEDAFEAFYKAANLNPEYGDAWAALGYILIKNGEIEDAIEAYGLAIKAEPDNIAYKQAIVKIIDTGRATFVKHNPEMVDLLLGCLETPEVECFDISMLWFSLLKLKPSFKPVYKISNAKGYSSFNVKSFERLSNLDMLLEPFFLHGLSQLLITDLVFEEFLISVRKSLLDDLEREEKIFNPSDYIALASALSIYCFRTDYILNSTEDEDIKIKALKETIEKDTGNNSEEFFMHLAIYGCYEGLSSLDKSNILSKAENLRADVTLMVDRQIRENETLERLSKTIPSLMEVEDKTSLKVKTQYQENPYPRWTTYHQSMYAPDLEMSLQKKGTKILVAGCGTGHETVELATVFPDADILAVDLSSASLSYAKMKAEKLGLTNLEFKQGDILKLGLLQDKYDYISCGGVLHHLEDPMRGWRVLRDLLKPHGLMRIALYSEFARKYVVKGIDVIKEKGLSPTVKDMKYFRSKSRELLGKTTHESLLLSQDYYNLSEYRDLLFHVQEHRFTTIKIEEYLNKLDLTFIKFLVSQGTLDLYNKDFPDDSECNNLQNWHKFEENNPTLFRSMYIFWCRGND